jgi:hypothetical protein
MARIICGNPHMTLTPVPSRSVSPDPARQAHGPAQLPAPARAPAGAGASRLTRTASQANLPSPLPKRPHGAASGSSGSAGSSPQRRAPLAALRSMRRSPSPEPLPDSQALPDMAGLLDLTSADLAEGEIFLRSPSPEPLPDLDALPELDDIAVLPDLTDFPEGDHAPRSPSPSLLFSQAETDQITPAGVQAAAVQTAASQAAEAVPYDPLAEPAEVHVPAGGLKVVRSAPIADEHKTLMASLPTDLSREYRSHVSRFLSHLENGGTNWASVGAPAVEGDSSHITELAALVNEVISKKVLHAATRAALNTAFGLDLQGISAASKLKNEEHRMLFESLSLDANLSKSHRSDILQFLIYLENKGGNWESVSTPAEGEEKSRPAALEALVNTAISKGDLNRNTRASLNRAFKKDELKLQGSLNRYQPGNSEHTNLMQTLPKDGLRPSQRSYVAKFLVHLESQGTDWKTVRGPNVTDLRPAALEEMVNKAITQHGFHDNLRSAINDAFGLKLLGPSGRERWPS